MSRHTRDGDDRFETLDGRDDVSRSVSQAKPAYAEAN